MSVSSPGDNTPGMPPSVAASQVLAGLPVEPASQPALARTRLSAIAAGALRAGLDFLLEAEPRHPLQLSAEDGALEVRFTDPEPAGLLAAASLLETVEGTLGPARSAGRWAIRVPVASVRPIYLMIEQGGLRLALPWVSVVRMRLATSFDTAARRQDHPVLPALAPDVTTAAPPTEGEPPMAERPAALVGLGLRRAWLIADRLVWRMPGEPVADSGLPEIAGLGPVVRARDGELYRVVDVAWLLRDVEPPHVPAPRHKVTPPLLPLTPPAVGPAPAAAEPTAPPATEPSSVESMASEDVAPAAVRHGGALPEQAEGPAPVPHAAPRLTVLTRERVEPLAPDAPTVSAPAVTAPMVSAPAVSAGAATQPAPPVAGDAGASPATPAPRDAAAPTITPRLRYALVAEDSISARIFLQRLLEQRGFLVSVVTSARALRSQLARGGWTIVLADVELPDSPAGAHLGQLGPLPMGARSTHATVALVRDAEDEARARAADVQHALWKPFAQEDLDRLLVALGLGPS